MGERGTNEQGAATGEQHGLREGGATGPAQQERGLRERGATGPAEQERGLRERGATPRVPHTSEQTHARISGVEGTPGVTFELLEFPPGSLVRKAMNAWKARPGTD